MIYNAHTPQMVLWGLLCIRDNFGGRCIELAGRVVLPEYQAAGIGSTLLQEYVAMTQTEYLATYTRNPAILKMMGRVCKEVYPLMDEKCLRDIAYGMPLASVDEDGIAYHVDRYGEGGLFGKKDPADRIATSLGGVSLKQLFVGLQSKRNALIVTSKVNTGNLQ